MNDFKVKKLKRAILSLLIAALGLLLLSGCEDVIDVNLNSAEPRIVIEGIVINNGSADRDFCRFNVRRTSDFYNPEASEEVSGAQIVLTDSFGHIDTLEEASGIYIAYYKRRIYPVIAGTVYGVTATIEGKTYTASAQMPAPILIDSLDTEYQDGGGIGSVLHKGYRIHVFFNDKPDVHDYARLIIGTRWKDMPEYYLYDGKFSDGNTIEYDYFFTVFLPGSEVRVELWSLDKAMFEYFQTLSEVAVSQEGNSFDVTPANPNTNWSNGALGYFGVFNISYGKITVPRE